MKSFALLASSIFILLSFSTDAFALKCNKCHRDEKSLDRVILERGVKNRQDLFNLTRNGPKAKLHKNLTDEEIAEAANFLNLR